MRTFDFRSGQPDGWSEFLSERRAQPETGLTDSVAKTLDEVRRRGLSAALDSARRFDCPDLEADALEVSEEELATARVEPQELEAIQLSIERVREFHRHQLNALTQGMDATVGGFEWLVPTLPSSEGREGQRLYPVGKAGLYIPGGLATYPSSVIMNAVPALVAGVRNVVICSPARRDGSMSPAVLVAARELGIHQMVKVGGASAIGLMAWTLGCDVIAGPGNKYVTEAKRQLWGQVGFDAFAGPSEVAVVADDSTPSRATALDLLTQIEHAPDNEGILITWQPDHANRIIQEVDSLLAQSPRAEIMRAALEARGATILASDRDQALTIANELAPEHLGLLIEDPRSALDAVPRAGSVALGVASAQSAGDFVNGPSHTLPTNASARFSSPVNVMTFMRFQSISALTKDDLRVLSTHVRTFGNIEGLPLHALAADPSERGLD